VTAAVVAGVRRLVLLSALGAEYDGHPLKLAEQAVHGSGVEWTILRPHWFTQNFSEDIAEIAAQPRPKTTTKGCGVSKLRNRSELGLPLVIRSNAYASGRVGP
jgi:uncharacterized protein YbjT (DUF2867 family)